MKHNKSSKKNSKHSDFESADSGNLKGKSVKKDKSSKRRLSIYDDFDENPLDSDFNVDDDYVDD